MVPEKHRAAAHAWVDGAQIEIHDDRTGLWLDNPAPCFYESCEYRIKPKPKVKKWRWVARGYCTDHRTERLFVTDDHYASEHDVWEGIPIERVDATEKEFDE